MRILPLGLDISVTQCLIGDIVILTDYYGLPNVLTRLLFLRMISY